MTLEQLRIFLAVAERQHLTRASEALNLTPSAVSSAVKALEDRYGVRLFNRIGRGIELTEAGRIFVDEARAALTRAQLAESALSELGGLARGSLRVHASQTIASYWAPEFVVRFIQAHPGIDLRLEMTNTQRVVAAMLDGSAELGLVEGEFDEPALGARVIAMDLLALVVAPDHPWADGRKLTPEELTAGRWVLREVGSGTRSAFIRALRARRVDPDVLDVALTLPSNEAVMLALQAGPFATVLSERVIAPFVEAGRLVMVDFALNPRPFRILWHKERFRTKAAQAFEKLILE